MARTLLISALTALVVALLVGFLPGWGGGTCSCPTEGEADESVNARLVALETRLAALEGRLAEAQASRPAGATSSTASASVPIPSPEPPRSAGGKTVEEWIELLESPDESEAFSATLQLGNMKAADATQPLIAVLKTHRDYYVRLGAATALGEIRAFDAVPNLIDAFDDPDALVRVAAADAFRSITGQDVGLTHDAGAKERQELQKTWRAWWAGNEAAVRAR